ncbi:MAG: biosynthetic peptidoglycan transglycosylase, partial [Bdellovibrionales bacterium]|nr:biosynthetic peptidoglycan transglycosylase [Bdellovibrionales bacterium]
MRIGLSLHRKLVFKFAAAVVGFAGLCGGLASLGILRPNTHVLKFQDVRANYQPSDRWIVDSRGRPLEALRTLQTHRSLEWVRFEEISPALIRTLIETEDRRFFEHHGFDLAALVKATWGLLPFSGARSRGGSTITMQLVKLLGVVPRNQGRYRYKARQIVEAWRYDMAWSKDEILEAYVNLASFRGEVVGLRAASLAIFGKGPRGLDEEDAAILVALLRAPNAASEAVKTRACHILRRNPERRNLKQDGQNESGFESGFEPCFESEFRAELGTPAWLERRRDLVPVLSK